MSSMRAGVASLVRRAFAARRPLGVGATTSSCSISSSARCATALPAAGAPSSLRSSTTGSGSGIRPLCSSSSGKKQQLQQQLQQRSGLSTLRRGLSGPQSARLRLPMRGLEEFRDPEIVKVRERRDNATQQEYHWQSIKEAAHTQTRRMT